MRNNAEIISYIKELMDIHNVNAQELSRRTGVAKSSMSRYLNQKREFPINDAHKFAKALHVTTPDLLGIQAGEIEETSNVDLPYFGAIAAGKFEHVDSTTGAVSVPGSIIKEDKDAYFVLKANGDSMNKVIANDHYVVVQDLINSSNNVLKTNDIVIAKNGSEYTMKRIRRTDKMVHLEPDSYIDEFETQSFRIEDINELEIIGKVVYSFREYN